VRAKAASVPRKRYATEEAVAPAAMTPLIKVRLETPLLISVAVSTCAIDPSADKMVMDGSAWQKPMDNVKRKIDAQILCVDIFST
jgi:hypothetical protein